MNRLIQTNELEQVIKLWVDVFGKDEVFARKIFCEFARIENVYVAEENGEIVSMLCAIPVTYADKKGAYLSNIATKKNYREKGFAKNLINFVMEKIKNKGGDFVTLIPQSKELFGFYEKMNFTPAFAIRKLKREVSRNLWAQAEFDSVTAKGLLELRRRFSPNVVELALPQMMIILADLYSMGVTIVHSANGYGLYFRKDNVLKFVELQAENEREAMKLMEAAREKEVFADCAEITVSAGQVLFLGEGEIQNYAMICYLDKPFNVQDGYMRLVLDNE